MQTACRLGLFQIKSNPRISQEIRGLLGEGSQKRSSVLAAESFPHEFSIHDDTRWGYLPWEA